MMIAVKEHIDFWAAIATLANPNGEGKWQLFEDFTT